jgi:hypothetical protein
VLTREDKNFWVVPAYRLPNSPEGDTSPAAVVGGQVSVSSAKIPEDVAGAIVQHLTTRCTPDTRR